MYETLAGCNVTLTFIAACKQIEATNQGRFVTEGCNVAEAVLFTFLMVEFLQHGWCRCFLQTAYCMFPGGWLQCRGSKRTLAFPGISQLVNGTKPKDRNFRLSNHDMGSDQIILQDNNTNQVHLDACCFIEWGDFEDEALPRVLLGRQMSGT